MPKNKQNNQNSGKKDRRQNQQNQGPMNNENRNNNAKNQKSDNFENWHTSLKKPGATLPALISGVFARYSAVFGSSAWALPCFLLLRSDASS